MLIKIMLIKKLECIVIKLSLGGPQDTIDKQFSALNPHKSALHNVFGIPITTYYLL